MHIAKISKLFLKPKHIYYSNSKISLTQTQTQLNHNVITNICIISAVNSELQTKLTVPLYNRKLLCTIVYCIL